jgi:hypothetical protein
MTQGSAKRVDYDAYSYGMATVLDTAVPCRSAGQNMKPWSHRWKNVGNRRTQDNRTRRTPRAYSDTKKGSHQHHSCGAWHQRLDNVLYSLDIDLSFRPCADPQTCYRSWWLQPPALFLNSEFQGPFAPDPASPLSEKKSNLCGRGHQPADGIGFK